MGHLDNLPVHVGHIQAAIRTIGKLNRSKPGIGGGKELTAAFIGRSLRHGLNSLVTDYFSVNQVVCRCTNEGVIHKVSPKGITPINGDARCGGEIPERSTPTLDQTGHGTIHAQLCTHHPPGFIWTNAEDSSCGSFNCNVLDQRWHGIPTVAIGITPVVHGRSDVVAIFADILAAARIKGHPVLGCAAFFA